MKSAFQHGFGHSLLVAAALHVAGAAVMAWCFAGRALPVAGTGMDICAVEVSIGTPSPVLEQPPVAPAPPAGWTPSLPQVVAVENMAMPLPDLPVLPLQKHTVPECVLMSPVISSVRADVVGPAFFAASSGTSTGLHEASGVVAAPGSPAGTNLSAHAQTGSGADTGLVVSGIVRPRYPDSARMRGEQGLVAVTVETDDEGRARQVTVTAASGFPALDRAAVEAARRARFVSSIAGAPASGKARLSFRFNLVD